MAKLDEAGLRAALEQAKARLETRSVTLNYTRITSPIDGRVGHSNFHVGSLVNPASGVLVEVVQLDPIRIAFALEEGAFATNAGQHADISAMQQAWQALLRHLPPEVIVQLVGHVIQTVRRQKGSPAAMPRIAQIQREGYRWKRLGLDSLELAEEYLRREQTVDRREWEILSIVGVTQRRPAVEKEREFIAAWVEMGFSDELIRLAWERTVYRKGQMNWPYMNKILLAWKQSGWTTPEQVLAGEKPPKRAAQAQPGPRPGGDTCQPSDERIKESSSWLKEFVKQQKDGESHGL